ncbi:thiol reductant ABC exporter subunit CydD [Paucilactobacillus suebicus]|uniref:Transport ATP-binding protein CydC n=1 Tax=Paucilactobacillus suebicus DSM 5007 = KCTC 3549 TaxID=1423807 RepID=A0A0R1W7R4_9LACO|nr:thiol reductant ABC exporter subunit CydD [Paucilactobacillus suebicus]KRM11995.1 transport ATP-binding protein CydC [Paucilactobacillus suebicus DSM 5007 = KCTC 3549]
MIDKQLMKLPGIKRVMGVLVGLSVLQAFFIIGQAYALGRSITNLWDGQSVKEQINLMILFAVVYLGRHLSIYFRNRLLDRYAYQQANDIRNQLLEKVFKLGPQVVQHQGTGSMVTMALDGVDQVEDYFHLILSKMINMMVIPWIILVAVYLLDVESGIILTLVFPLIIIFMIILGYAAQGKADKQFAVFQMLSNHFIDSLRGIDTLKYFGLSKKYANSIFNTSERFRKATMNTLKIAILSTFALDFFTTLSIAIVAVFLGLRLIDAHILLFPALTVLILVPEYFLPIRDFSGDYHATLNGKNSMHAIYEILDQPEDQTEPVKLQHWDENQPLNVSHLNFDYVTGAGLKDLNLNFSGYEKVGIIGVSGSGKSTLINVLSGFLTPRDGNIKVGNAELTSFNQPDWQKQLIYIPQNPYIFQMTVRDNIAFYHPNATDDEVRQAIEVVGLQQLVDDLPEGLDTVIGEGARSLSGGQSQRVALARAFLDQNRRVLLFDEPTAHLDIETEVELRERMIPIMKNHLVFFATHRLHWMKEMDYILVMDHGQVVEQGTLDELQANNGAFAKLTAAMRGKEAHDE